MRQMSGLYSIKDLEQLSGIKAHTLRIWEQRYNILKPQRTDTNIRFYSSAELRTLLNISVLNSHGIKISKIADMSIEELCHEVRKLTDACHKFSDQVQSLTLSMLEMDEDRFEKLVNTNLLHFGLEKTMIDVIHPFLLQIGILWQTGSINTSHEHFITNLIKQKLYVAIDGQKFVRNTLAKKFILYLPEGELHEISLLFANFILRSKGHLVTYLGQSLPMADLFAVNEIKNPDYIFTIITSTPHQEEAVAYINALSKAMPKQKLLITGYQVTSQKFDVPPNVQILSKMSDLESFY
jgi:DNA-binding transcriptional MerR regulator